MKMGGGGIRGKIWSGAIVESIEDTLGAWTRMVAVRR